jgi:two-component system chemotaxis sensor kinase CheA
VAIILDVAGLAAKATLTSLSESTRAKALEREVAEEAAGDRLSLMLFHNAPDETCGILLERVSRLESIDASRVEMFGGTRSMQYRDRQLPLFALKDVARVGDIADDAERVVLVVEAGGREVGLLAAMPVDIVDTTVTVDTTHRQPGISGTCILRNRTTLIVDIDELAGVARPSGPAGHFPAASTEHLASPQAGAARAAGPAILLAEDSDFFRAQMQRLLLEDGYTVLAAPDGQAAWELLLKHQHEVRLVVTDIEMPRLNGLELTRRIRSEPAVSAIPIIAVTTLADEDDTARGRAAGVDYYQVKLDKERLLETVRLALSRLPASTRE